MMQPRRSYDGFTLIEVLVALALMSLLSTALLASLNIAGRTWRHETSEVADLDQIVRAQDFLRRRLESIQPAPPSDAAFNASGLKGTSTSLEFESSSLEFENDGFFQFRIRAQNDDQQSLQISYRQPAAVGFVAEDNWFSESLVPKIAGLSIAYWESSLGEPGRWTDHWEGPALPKLIRIEVRFAPEDHRSWPPLYVEPHIDTDPGCAFDPISRRCRDSA